MCLEGGEKKRKELKKKKKLSASTGNRTRVTRVAGEYSTTRPPMRLGNFGNYNSINTKLQLYDVTSVHKNPRCVSFRLGSASTVVARQIEQIQMY